jgi:hypothetical protein
MLRVIGRVLVHETGTPLPNVIVAAFDTDQLGEPPKDPDCS